MDTCVYEYHVSIENMRIMDGGGGTEREEAKRMYAEMSMTLWIRQ